MVLSVHSFAAFQSDSGWPSFWPPVQLPPPSPLSAAATTLWSPKLGGTATGTALTLDPLYSAQLGQATQGSTQGAQIAFLDQRIALIRFDAGQAPNGPGPDQGGAAA
jgi:hypothetical protein